MGRCPASSFCISQYQTFCLFVQKGNGSPGAIPRLSDTSLEAIRILSSTNLLYSAHAKDIISKIPTNEIDSVMDEVIKNINNSPSWTNMEDVNGLSGAILLAQNQPTVNEKLIDFLTHIDKTKNKLWIKTLIKSLRGK